MPQGSILGPLLKLQLVQNFAARIVTKSWKFDHITPILKQLKWIPVKDTLYLREAVMTFKSIKNLASNQLHLKVMSCQLIKRHYKYVMTKIYDLQDTRQLPDNVHLSIEHVKTN